MEALILLSILPALYWLMRESNWLRVNLNYIPEVLIRKSWDDLKNGLRIPTKQAPTWYKFPEIMEPLCGREYLETHMHVIPEYKIEVKAWGVKNSIVLKQQADSTFLKDVAVSMLKPNKEQRSELTASRKRQRQLVTV